MNTLNQIAIDYVNDRNVEFKQLNISYHLFGQKLGKAPVILVNHALTGNSEVCGKKGWFKDIVGYNKAIDLNIFTVIAFNTPGNGYQSEQYYDAKDLNPSDIAQIYLKALQELELFEIYAIIGTSVGGGIAWEMFFKSPNLTKLWIPIACDWESKSWIKAIQKLQLETLKQQGIAAARAQSMLYFRTPQSLDSKFPQTNIDIEKHSEVSDWLDYHGKALKKRFALKSYAFMMYLLGNINAYPKYLTNGNTPLNFKGKILQIGIDSDLLFPVSYQKEITNILTKKGIQNQLETIISPHGHDAFLIEHEQLSNILKKHIPS